MTGVCARPWSSSEARVSHRPRQRQTVGMRSGTNVRGASRASFPSAAAPCPRVDGLRDNVIATGGGPGIMEAANRGAQDAGAPSIGFNITLPHEQEPNAYSTPDLTFRFHYFAMRKMHLAMRASALAVFPGGFGTMDELFELLTLQQTQKAPKMPIVLFGREYWTKVINFEAMVDAGMLAASDLTLFEIVDDIEEGWNSMVRRGVKVACDGRGRARMNASLCHAEDMVVTPARAARKYEIHL